MAASTSTENDASNGSLIASIRIPLLTIHPNPTHDRSSSSSKLIPRSEFENAYGPYQALLIRGFVPQSSVLPSNCASEQFQASDVQSLFESLKNQDKESWCIENKSNHSENVGDEKAHQITPSEFLDTMNSNQRGYCSFLVQHSKVALNKLLSDRLPMAHLPVANGSESATEEYMKKVHYGPCLWFFFGKNSVNEGKTSDDTQRTALQGRPEHTDSVTHDGTWHYQLSGTKVWRLRPTTELMQRIREHKQQQMQERPLSGSKRKACKKDTECNAEEDETNRDCDDVGKNCIQVECKQGDILLLNTRLWWHSTLLPTQDVPCISYARDVYFPDSGAAVTLAAETSGSCDSKENKENCREKSEKQDQQLSSMTNVEGTYAAEDIGAETILFTEHTMPDCELHRSKTNANCQVVELEDEKTGESYMAVVSIRDIKAGDFFSVLESDEEEEDDSEVEEEEWDDDDS